MDLITPRDFFTLGYNLRALLDVTAGKEIGGENGLLEILQGSVTTLEQLQFTVSSEVFKSRLRPIMDKLVKAVEADPAATVGTDLAQRFATEAGKLIPAVSAECKTGFIARPASARFHVEQLLVAPESLLASGAFQALPPIAQTDFREASGCLAFGLSTAAAFHALRCVEECVRWLHRSYYPGKKQNKAWGPLANELAQVVPAVRWRGADDAVRDPDHICPDEVAEAAVLFVQRESGIPLDDLPAATLRDMGFKRISPKLAELASAAIQQAIAAQRIRPDGSGFMIAAGLPSS